MTCCVMRHREDTEVTYRVKSLLGPICSSIAFVLSTLIMATVGNAGDFSTYRNSQYKYAIIYPADWKIARDDGKVFSVLNKSKDININVVAEELEPSDRRYKRITDIPNIREDMTSSIRRMAKTPSVESGSTILSNEPALWFKYYYFHQSLDVELFFDIYQIVLLKNDIKYIITAKVSGMSRKLASTKFEKYRPIIKKAMISFTLTELVK